MTYLLGILKVNNLKVIALANDLTLVTHNTREFERVDGLQIEDWEFEV
jgi:tRNA(fMet)-specific endonuclease VapC